MECTGEPDSIELMLDFVVPCGLEAVSKKVRSDSILSRQKFSIREWTRP